MGKPSVRLGDATAHGGQITSGCSTVLVGGKPAARVLDTHVCPQSTGTVPHVGGPILGPGSPTVLIGGMAASCIGDIALCTGPPDSTAAGEPTVLIGCFAGPPGTSGVLALPSKTPSEREKETIRDALASGDYQRAIDLTVAALGIETRNVPSGVKYNPTERNYGATDFQGHVSLGPAAMSSDDVLASTIVHEVTHANQAASLQANDSTLLNWPADDDAVNYDEAMAYQSELYAAESTGLNDNAPEYQVAAGGFSQHARQLSPAMQRDLAAGRYPP